MSGIKKDKEINATVGAEFIKQNEIDEFLSNNIRIKRHVGSFCLFSHN